MVRRMRDDTRTRTQVPDSESNMRLLCRLTFHVRRRLLFALETLFPRRGRLPEISQVLDTDPVLLGY